jgi:tetratricopeptide (TPR) repeat protein
MQQLYTIMKRPFVLPGIFLVLISFNLFGQRVEQKGWVTELSSGKKSLSGVQILFIGSSPEVSNNDGIFGLSFNEKSYGDLIFSEKISKEGYELVNDIDLKHTTLSKDSLVVVMCKDGLIAKMKAEYYDISMSTFTKNHEIKLNELTELLKKNIIDESAYQKEIFDLEEKFKKAKEYAKQLAEKYARTNFDDVSEIYKEAFNYFKDGELDKTIELLDKVQIVERVKLHLNDDQKIKALTHELLIAKAENEKGIKQDMEALELAAEMYNLKFDYEKADKMYHTLWTLDSTNVKNTTKYAAFLFFNEKHTKAIEFFLKITGLDVDMGNVANAFGMIGILYEKMGDYQNANVYFEKQKDILYQLMIEFPENNDFVTSYSMALTNLSDIFLLRGDLKSAINLQEESLEIIDKTLIQINDDELTKMQKCNIHFKLYDSYGKIGNLKKSQYHYQQFLVVVQDAFNITPSGMGMDLLNKANQLQVEGKLSESVLYYKKYKEQCQQNQDNFNMPVAAMKNIFKSTLADAYGYLGTAYSLIGKTIESIEEYKSQLEILNDLYSGNPETMEYSKKLAKVHSALSNVYNIIGDGKNGFYHLNEAHNFFKLLHQKSPENFELSNDYAQSCISVGNYYKYYSTDPSSSIQYYEEAIVIFKSNYEKDKNNQFTGSSLVTAYLGLAEAYQKKSDFQSGNNTVIKAGSLAEELNKTFPDNDYIKQELGNCNLMQGNLSDNYQYRLKCFRNAREIFNDLHAKSPVNLAYIASLATSEYNISLTLFNEKKYSESIVSAKRSFELRKNLGETDANNNFNKYFVGIASAQVGQVFERLYELDSALCYYNRGHAISSDLLKADPQNPGKKFDVANAYNTIGILSYKQNDFQKASEYFAQALSMYIELNTALPNDNVKRQIEFTSMQIAILQNDFKPVIAYFQKIINEMNQFPKDFASDIGDAYNSQSFFYRLNKEYDKAKEAAINAKRFDKASKWPDINLLITQILLHETNNPEEQLQRLLNKPTIENPEKTFKEIVTLGILKMERSGIDDKFISKLKNICSNN